MQEISFDKLKKLAKKPITEAKNTQPYAKLFDEVVNVYKTAYKNAKSDGLSDGDSDLQAGFAIKRFIKIHKCPPVEYVGEGSSRIAYALDGGLCLKVAYNEAGKAQNKVEFNNCKNLPKFFPAMYEASKDFEVLLVECCSPCHNDSESVNRVKQALEIKYDMNIDVTDAIALVLDKAASYAPGDFEAIYESMLQDIEIENYGEKRKKAYESVINVILQPHTIAQKTFSNLAKWCLANVDKIDVIDFSNIENWGFVAREGEIVPIIIDVGFSPAVQKMFYS